jgi:hypothetical protein
MNVIQHLIEKYRVFSTTESRSKGRAGVSNCPPLRPLYALRSEQQQDYWESATVLIVCCVEFPKSLRSELFRMKLAMT